MTGSELVVAATHLSSLSFSALADGTSSNQLSKLDHLYGPSKGMQRDEDPNPC